MYAEMINYLHRTLGQKGFRLLTLIAVMFIIIVIFQSCAEYKTVEEKFIPSPEYQHRAVWFDGDTKFQFTTTDGKISPHPFFDTDSAFDREHMRVNYLPIVQKENSTWFGYDLNSGRKFKSHKLCGIKPNFHWGILPRAHHEQTIDELSSQSLQKILVFPSDLKKKIFLDLEMKEFSRAKIVGSFELLECRNFPCKKNHEWKSERILLALDVKKIDRSVWGSHPLLNIENWEKSQEWEKTKNFLETEIGVHRTGGKGQYARFKVGVVNGLEETRKYLNEKVQFFEEKKLLEWKNQCQKDFDQWYLEFLTIQNGKDSLEKLKLFTMDLLKKTTIAKHHSCLHSVRSGNINDDHKRFWWFQFVRAVFLLEQEGFYFNCQQKTWYQNAMNSNGIPLYSSIKEIERCRARDAQNIYRSAINGLSYMQNQIGKSYRFVEYDTQTGGSFQKIYSWIPVVPPNQFQCPKDNIVLENTFPEDIDWMDFSNEQTPSHIIE